MPPSNSMLNEISGPLGGVLIFFTAIFIVHTAGMYSLKLGRYGRGWSASTFLLFPFDLIWCVARVLGLLLFISWGAILTYISGSFVPILISSAIAIVCFSKSSWCGRVLSFFFERSWLIDKVYRPRASK